MSCINSLSQADIGLSQKVMRNAKTFYHNSTIGAPPGLVLHLSNYPLEHQEGKVRSMFAFLSFFKLLEAPYQYATSTYSS